MPSIRAQRLSSYFYLLKAEVFLRKYHREQSKKKSLTREFMDDMFLKHILNLSSKAVLPKFSEHTITITFWFTISLFGSPKMFHFKSPKW